MKQVWYELNILEYLFKIPVLYICIVTSKGSGQIVQCCQFFLCDSCKWFELCHEKSAFRVYGNGEEI